MTAERPSHITMLAFVSLGLIWGSNFIFMKWAAALISPVQVVFLRVVFGFFPILGLALYRGALRRSDLRHWPHFAVMSILATAFYYYAFAKGAALLPSGVAGMLSGAIPLFTFVMTALFLKEEPLTARKIFGVGLGFLGVLLIARPWSTGDGQLNLWGVVYMILGSLSLGSSFVYARRFMANLNISALALSTYQVGIALCILAAMTPFSGLGNIGRSPVALIGLVFGLGLTGTGIANVLYYFIVQQMGAVQASTVTYLPPVVALLIGCLLVGEPLRAMDLIALMAILIGVYVIQTSSSSRNESGAESARQPDPTAQLHRGR
jgi:drug/metabolite transporter (DMT)-like permease